MISVPVSVLAGASAAALVLVGAVPRRPRPARLPLGPWATEGVGASTGALERLGRTIASRWGSAPDPATARRIGRTAVVAALAVLVTPPLAALVVLGSWVRARTAVMRRRQDEERTIAAVLPDAVDLLLLCTGAGMSLPLAHDRIAARVPAPVGGALTAAAIATRSGRPRADALADALGPLGDRALALSGVLGDHLRYGTPIGPGLDRLSMELRLDRRRRAEVEARKVPVRLLGPLVACVLPAFALLTVVPLLAASLDSLRI